MASSPTLVPDHAHAEKLPTTSSPGSTHSSPSTRSLALKQRTDGAGTGTATPTSPTGKKEKKVSAPPAGHAGMQAPLEIPRWRFWTIFLSLMVAIFLFALDQLIIATAIPKITVEFNSLTELPWLASGFFLTLFGFNLMYSQWNQIFPSKDVIMFAVSVFEIGSLVCGVAPSMEVLILGRAIAGLGAAGIFSGGMIIIAEITSLSERPKYFGLFGVCFAIASIIGPLIGGAFSDHVSWRWCFYINLPIGGVALVMITFFQPRAPPLGRAATYKGYSKDMFLQVIKCDWLGVAMAMGWGVCVILSMQWGGVTKAWNDGSVIACLVMIPVIGVLFVVYEWWLGDRAMFRLALLTRRTMIGASIVLFFLFATFMLEVYYISLAFQAAYDNSATEAGVKLLPFILVQVVVLIMSSRIIPLLGRFKWVIVAGPCFLAIGCGLLYSIKYGTPESALMGYQAFLGIGIGMAMQNTMLAVQFELKSEPWLISAGTGMAVFIGFAGRIIGISLAGSVFENMIQVNLAKYAPTLPYNLVLAVVNDASAVWTVIPASFRESVLIAYTESLRDVYVIGLPCSILALGGALVIKNQKMPTKAEEQAAFAAAKEKAALAKAKADGTIPADAEEKVGAGAGITTGEEAEAEAARREEMIAEDTAAIAPLPQQAVEGGVDAQALLATQEGRSAV